MKPLLRICWLTVFSATLLAQTAVVKRNVNLRPDASTDNPSIELLKPPLNLSLLETGSTAGYYHVTAPDGKTGFVWARNVEIQEEPAQPGGGTDSAGLLSPLTTN